MDFAKRLIVKPRSKVHLARFDTAGSVGPWDKESSEAELRATVERIAALQYTMYAENRRSLLVVLQGMDTSGKDGVIRHVFSGVNPQGCSVTSFKQPSEEELDHDYLWRIHKACPARGDIGVFNRSHYESVLVERVRELVPREVWKERFAQINWFEEHLVATGTVVIKFFLHVGKAEQKRRLEQRLSDPLKNWKSNAADFEVRAGWDAYMRAYTDALERCSTAYAPWFVVPADHKWFRNLAVSKIVLSTLESMKLSLPPPTASPERKRAPSSAPVSRDA